MGRRCVSAAVGRGGGGAAPASAFRWVDRRWVRLLARARAKGRSGCSRGVVTGVGGGAEPGRAGRRSRDVPAPGPCSRPAQGGLGGGRRDGLREAVDAVLGVSRGGVAGGRCPGASLGLRYGPDGAGTPTRRRSGRSARPCPLDARPTLHPQAPTRSRAGRSARPCPLDARPTLHPQAPTRCRSGRSARPCPLDARPTLSRQASTRCRSGRSARPCPFDARPAPSPQAPTRHRSRPPTGRRSVVVPKSEVEYGNRRRAAHRRNSAALPAGTDRPSGAGRVVEALPNRGESHSEPESCSDSPPLGHHMARSAFL